MALPAGLGGQIGFVEESGSYGNAATVTRFLEFESEGIVNQLGHVESYMIGRGRYLYTGRNKTFSKGAAGPVTLPVMAKGFGLVFKHMLGNFAAAQVNSTSEYLHTIQTDAVGKVGLYLTTQVGRPDASATVRPFTFAGCKITSWELKCDLDGQLKATIDLDSKAVVVNTALASPSYASTDYPFYFTDGVVSLGNSNISVRSLSIKGDDALDTDRRFIGNTKAEPLPSGEATIMVDLDYEFESLARYNGLVLGTEVSNLVATFDTGVAIPTGNGSNFKAVVTIAKLVPQDGQASIGGVDLLREGLSYKAVNDGSNPLMKIQYYTTDTAA